MSEDSASDIEAIKQLKSRYFRFIDQKRWDDFELLFTEAAEFDVSGELERIGRDPEEGKRKGRSNIRKSVESVIKDALTIHHGHMPEIEIVAPGRAEGIWAMEDVVDFNPGGEKPSGIHGYGHYFESYEKLADGKWYISKLKLVRLSVNPLGG